MADDLNEFTVREQGVGGGLLDVVRRRGSADAFTGRRLMILVHGFNVTQDEAALSLAGFHRRLSDHSRPGAGQPYAAWAFYWPGDHQVRWLSAATYAARIDTAGWAGERLGKLLTKLRPDQQVVLIGHSLGCRVVLQALKYVASARVEGTSSAQVIGVCLMAAAVPAGLCAGAGEPYRSGVIQDPVHVLHSRNDCVLQRMFPQGQALKGEFKGEAVGRNGGPPERWARLHDTGLGHSDYLSDPGAAAEVARILDPALPRFFPGRPVPRDHCLRFRKLTSRKLAGRRIGDPNAGWTDCWPVAGAEGRSPASVR